MVLLKTVASRLSSYCEQGGILPKEQCGFRTARSTECVLSFADCKNSDERGKSPCTCASSTCRKHTTLVDRELLWKRFARFGVPAMVFAVIRQFYGDMRARVHTNYGEHSERFDVTQGLSAGLRAIAVVAQHVLRRSVTRCPRSLQRGLRHRAEPSPPR